MFCCCWHSNRGINNNQICHIITHMLVICDNSNYFSINSLLVTWFTWLNRDWIANEFAALFLDSKKKKNRETTPRIILSPKKKNILWPHHHFHIQQFHFLSFLVHVNSINLPWCDEQKSDYSFCKFLNDSLSVKQCLSVWLCVCCKFVLAMTPRRSNQMFVCCWHNARNPTENSADKLKKCFDRTCVCVLLLLAACNSSLLVESKQKPSKRNMCIKQHRRMRV